MSHARQAFSALVIFYPINPPRPQVHVFHTAGGKRCGLDVDNPA
ncbi:hypothetical protein R1G71_19020 [Stenotrophomonas sp. C1657]|jgi:hypothetical protein|nr:hypothetical protein [Stenotrophomonas sp. C1657]